VRSEAEGERIVALARVDMLVFRSRNCVINNQFRDIVNVYGIKIVLKDKLLGVRLYTTVFYSYLHVYVIHEYAKRLYDILL